MFEVYVSTDLCCGRLALACGVEAVSKLFAVIGEDLSDSERCRVDQALNTRCLQFSHTVVSSGQWLRSSCQMNSILVFLFASMLRCLDTL